MEFFGLIVGFAIIVWFGFTMVDRYYNEKARKLSFSDIAYVAQHGSNTVTTLGNYFKIPEDIMRRRLIVLGFKVGEYNFEKIKVPVRDDDPTEEFVRMG